MGNCQAIDNATLLIQHPKGRVDKLYSPVSASDIMKANPGHYVALLLNTTLYSSSSGAGATTIAASAVNNNSTPLRVTRIKLLRPNDTLVLGRVYRLVTTQEVMNGLWAKNQAKMKQQKQQPGYAERCRMTDKEIAYYESLLRTTEEDNSKLVKPESHRSRNNTAVNSAAAASKSRAWQPSLKSISEATS